METTALTAADRRFIEQKTREWCASRAELLARDNAPGSYAVVDPDEAVQFALGLYETAARFGLDRDSMGFVTDFVDAAVSGLGLRNGRRMRGRSQ